MEHNSNNIPELQSPFEQLKEVDANGKEWWNSRKLARVMGYGKYWNFERVIAKAQAWASQKGYHLGEHFVEITEMAELGNAAVREVTSIRLSVFQRNHDSRRCREKHGILSTHVQRRTWESTGSSYL